MQEAGLSPVGTGIKAVQKNFDWHIWEGSGKRVSIGD